MTDLVKFKVRYDTDIAAGNVNTGDSDQIVADYYNAADTIPDAEVRATREQIMEAIDVGEFKALTAAERDAVTLVLLPDSVLVRGSNARAIILDAFSAGTDTRTNLGALQATLETAASRTRAERGGMLGNARSVTDRDVARMRAI